jgi:hypothetical protein
MGNPVFRFTLSHADSGTSKIISEPIGWKECTLKLERHPEFHSLIEYFEGGSNGGFTFYGNNGVDDGGVDYIRNIEKAYGFNTKIRVTVDVSFHDGDGYSNVFVGLLGLGQLKEDPDNKITIPILPDTLWTKFMSRMNTKVELGSSTDLDGNAVGATTSITVNLPSQAVRTKFKRTINYNADNEGLFTSDEGSAGTTHYLIFDNSRYDLDEIEERFEYGTQVSAIDPTTVEKYIIKAKYGGDYAFDIDVRYFLVFGAATNVTVQWYLKIKDKDGVLTTTNIGAGTSGVGVTTHKTGATAQSLTHSATLSAGDEIFIYGVVTTSVSTTVSYFPDFDNDSGAPFDDEYTELEITGDTIYPDSTATGYTVYDALQGVLVRYGLSSSPFYSDYLNPSISGCASKFVLVKGLQLRGYTLTEKPFSISFKELWDGLNPILNLGLGNETINGVEKIRIEEKAHFYQNDSASVLLDNIFASREYDEKYIIKKIDIGYSQWQSENISGIDDPQTKHSYASALSPYGTELTLYSGFIAASLAIETCRRVEKTKKSKDHKFDNETFIIACSNTSSPFDPELDDNYGGITNLLNSDTRYNLILTPKRNLYRWANYFLGGFQKYLSGSLQFVYGEGNTDLITSLNNGTNICLGITESATENADFVLDGFVSPGSFSDPGNPYLHLAISHTFQTKLSWEDYTTIRNNKKKALSISQTATNHKRVSIEKFELTICSAQVKASVWQAEPFDLVVPQSEQIMTNCE